MDILLSMYRIMYISRFFNRWTCIILLINAKEKKTNCKTRPERFVKTLEWNVIWDNSSSYLKFYSIYFYFFQFFLSILRFIVTNLYISNWIWRKTKNTKTFKYNCCWFWELFYKHITRMYPHHLVAHILWVHVNILF